MIWTYQQSTGYLLKNNSIYTQGYSGFGIGKNNPQYQDKQDIGPIPQGIYTILSPVDTRTHGPYVLWLVPNSSNEMFGRSGFGIHGDSLVDPGNASEGCIILPKIIREQIWSAGDYELEVVK